MGDWTKNPYQRYTTLIDLNTRLLYKEVEARQWEIFYPKEHSRNIYIPVNITQHTLPEQWIPIRVINLSIRKLVVIDTDNVQTPLHIKAPIFGSFLTREERKVVGHFQIDTKEMRKLKERWALEPIRLQRGADEGLKDGLGSSGYCIVAPDGEAPVVTGLHGRVSKRTTCI